jgi:hypothetical protein
MRERPYASVEVVERVLQNIVECHAGEYQNCNNGERYVRPCVHSFLHKDCDLQWTVTDPL